MFFEILSTMTEKRTRCDESEHRTWWQRNLCDLTMDSTRNISDIRPCDVPAALRPFRYGPYQITRIQLELGRSR